ncbi:MAG: glycosyltransferase family 4 protein [Anaerolineae bacterium]
MHIGLDYTPALKQSAGIGRYTRGLVGGLAELGAGHQYTLLAARDAPLAQAPALPPNFRLQRLPLPERWLNILWHHLNLPLALDRLAGPFDLFHSPNFVLPPLARSRGLVTVHDLSFLRYPAGADPGLRAWLERVVPRSLARAEGVLADSRSTKADLIDLLNIPPERIDVVGAGVEDRFRPVSDEAALARVRRRYGLPDRFILSLGTLEPRKNFTGLIRAFAAVAAADETLHLVIGGGRGWLFDQIFRAAAESPVRERIHLPGFIDEADLPALYTLATVFAFPSFYEGFGIPVLEAMACGTPVVCADNSSLPEVAGEAALLLPAGDVEALGRALLRCLKDEALRRALVARGFEQARKFPWTAAAEQLLVVYERISAKQDV